ncbi:pyridoxamine 5'-phosphate oxidase family protein [Frankia sp. AgB32]|uniref:pyridoxamine 5'-phosphate oxidase family protein n=1 Tax=Frankia sp. AgB32 TaxID=631119 RepID=UPI00200C9351|nr:pyridoxamine 5'-phosphate oxidase family protein [Frankia sp. AgB32]MCK9893612.1 pyridoxamine 5'-phosphate oxidase family protein [Frankia sp. AgB32]
MPTISPSHRDLLENHATVALATVGSDGQPQVTAIWALLDGDVVRTSLTKARQKPGVLHRPDGGPRRGHPERDPHRRKRLNQFAHR